MSDLFSALGELQSDIGINAEYIKESIIKAVSSVCKNTYGIEDAYVGFDKSGELVVKVNKLICETVDDPMLQISLDDALKIDPNAKIGDHLQDRIDTKEFGRIAAQTVRTVVRQGIRDGEKELVISKLRCYEKELVSAKIVRFDVKKEFIILKIGESETSLPKNDLKLVWPRKEGDFIKVYVSRIEVDGPTPIPIVSRSCPELVCKLFENEVPEIKNGIVTIDSIAREAGMRSKIAVSSTNPEVDPVGSCIGAHGSRIQSVVDELNGEKIDVIRYSDDPVDYISAAIAPAKVLSIQVDSESDNTKNECLVTVPESQLSLAIGSKGQNVRLASRLTGWKINLKSEDGQYGY